MKMGSHFTLSFEDYGRVVAVAAVSIRPWRFAGGTREQEKNICM
jgi:hypothetical protein